MTLQIDLKQLKAGGASNNYVLAWSNASNSWVSANASGLLSLPAANSSVAGVVQVLDSYTNTSISIAAAANAVKTAYDTAVTAQNMASAAYTNASSVAVTAYTNAVSQAASLAATAYSNATNYADSRAATAYINAASYADTKAATAYANAYYWANSLSATAYSNAVAYAASNSYVNSTFAPKANPTFTGTVSGVDMSLSGNLTVSGSLTYINTSALNIGDNIITLNADIANTTSPTENAGIEINRGSSPNVAIRWTESIGKWQATNDGTTYANIAIGAVGATLTANNTDNQTYYLPMSNATTGSWTNAVAYPYLTLNPGTAVMAFGDPSQSHIAISSSYQTISVGNTTVNATINSTSFALNGVDIRNISLDNLTDVTITAPTNNQILKTRAVTSNTSINSLYSIWMDSSLLVLPGTMGSPNDPVDVAALLAIPSGSTVYIPSTGTTLTTSSTFTFHHVEPGYGNVYSASVTTSTVDMVMGSGLQAPLSTITWVNSEYIDPIAMAIALG